MLESVQRINVNSILPLFSIPGWEFNENKQHTIGINTLNSFVRSTNVSYFMQILT